MEIFSGVQMKKNEMSGLCGTFGRGERRIYGFGGETRRNETIWKN